MFQTGSLTLKPAPDDPDQIELAYPNREVESAFKEDLFQNLWYPEADMPQGVRGRVRRMWQALVAEEYQAACDGFNALLDGFPYQTLAASTHFQAILHAVCMFLPVSQLESERSDRYGRMDTVVETPMAFVIFEFKHNESAAAAAKQLRNKRYGTAFKDSGKKVVGLCLNFNTPHRQDPEGHYDADANLMELEIVQIHAALETPAT